MSETYHDGDDVPREWFSKIENVKSMKFRCECSATMEDGRRVVRRIGGGEYMLYIEPTVPGVDIILDCDPQLYLHTGPAAALSRCP